MMLGISYFHLSVNIDGNVTSDLTVCQLETYMDEKFISRAFSTMGEEAVSVRIIRNKMTGWVLGPHPRSVSAPAVDVS